MFPVDLQVAFNLETRCATDERGHAIRMRNSCCGSYRRKCWRRCALLFLDGDDRVGGDIIQGGYCPRGPMYGERLDLGLVP